MRKSGLLLFGLAVCGLSLPYVTAGTAQAQRRPDTLTMSCASARALVQKAGAIVLGTGPNIYDRYVNHRGYCTPSEDIDPAYVSTRDRQACFIGYTCREIVQEMEP